MEGFIQKMRNFRSDAFILDTRTSYVYNRVREIHKQWNRISIVHASELKHRNGISNEKFLLYPPPVFADDREISKVSLR